MVWRVTGAHATWEWSKLQCTSRTRRTTPFASPVCPVWRRKPRGSMWVRSGATLSITIGDSHRCSRNFREFDCIGVRAAGGGMAAVAVS